MPLNKAKILQFNNILIFVKVMKCGAHICLMLHITTSDIALANLHTSTVLLLVYFVYFLYIMSSQR